MDKSGAAQKGACEKKRVPVVRGAVLLILWKQWGWPLLFWVRELSSRVKELG